MVPERTDARGTPLEMPRSPAYPKSYSAVLRRDGSLLPIEERLGRRLLRTIDASSQEGRALLDEGRVSLWSADGERISPPSSPPPRRTSRRRPRLDH